MIFKICLVNYSSKHGVYGNDENECFMSFLINNT